MQPLILDNEVYLKWLILFKQIKKLFQDRGHDLSELLNVYDAIMGAREYLTIEPEAELEKEVNPIDIFDGGL